MWYKSHTHSYVVLYFSFYYDRNHLQRVVSMFYCFLIFAIGLSITLYNTGEKEAETENSFVVSYLVIIIITLFINVSLLYTLSSE